MWTRMYDFDQMFGAMDLLRSRMDRLFNDYNADVNWRLSDTGPRTNMYDKGDIFEIHAVVPGFEKENLHVKIQGNYLELSGTRNTNSPEGYKKHRVERRPSSFTRSFTLPADVDAERTEANLKDGILILTLPKAEVAKPKQITIQ